MTSTSITEWQGRESSAELIPHTGLPSQSVSCLLFIGVLPSVFFFKACCEVEVLRLEMVSQDDLGALQHNQFRP